MSFDSIGYFQFDNLIQSRIPMVLIMLDEVPLKSWYNSMIGMHIDMISLVTTPEKAVDDVQNKKLPLHFAVVVLDQNERKSPAIAKKLESIGFINAYYVKGGWDGLISERQSGGG